MPGADSVRARAVQPAMPTDVAALFDSLAERLNSPGAQERWYPGSFARADTALLPYYRVPAADDLTDLLEAALVRPAGIDFDFDDWLTAFERSRKSARAARRGRTTATMRKIALVSATAGALTGIGLWWVASDLTERTVRPGIAFAATASAVGLSTVLVLVRLCITRLR